MKLSLTKTNVLFAGFLAFILLACSLLWSVQTVKATIAVFFRAAGCTNNSTLATTTIAWMTPGTATSTVTCAWGFDSARSAVLIVQENASTTHSTFNYIVEEGDGQGNWYPVAPGTLVLDALSSATAASSTIWITPANQITFANKFSSTTLANEAPQNNSLKGYNGTFNRYQFAVTIPVRMQAVRVHATMASSTTGSNGNGNGGVWMQIQPVIEQ